MDPAIRRACEEIRVSAEALVRSHRARQLPPISMTTNARTRGAAANPTGVSGAATSSERSVPQALVPQLRLVVDEVEQKLKSNLSPSQKQSLLGHLRQLMSRLRLPWGR